MRDCLTRLRRANTLKKSLKQGVFVFAVAISVAAGTAVAQNAKDGSDFQFAPSSLVLTTSDYAGNASTVKKGEDLPLGCPGGANGNTNVPVPTFTPDVSIIVNVPCGIASDSGEAPHASDPHNVWNNSTTDGSFGISSPIVLDNLTTDGVLLGAVSSPTIEIADQLQLENHGTGDKSLDRPGNPLTFVSYHGGWLHGGYPVSPTAPKPEPVMSRLPICLLFAIRQIPSSQVSRAVLRRLITERSPKWMHKGKSVSPMGTPTAATTVARR